MLFRSGLQLGSFLQLRDAVAFFKKKGVQIKTLPAELFPGIGHSALVLDPDGHAMQLYCYMEQIGWDGKPRPAAQRAPIDNAHWPEMLDAESDIYNGEVFLGPIG